MRRWKDKIQKNQDLIIGTGFLCLVLLVLFVMYLKSTGII